MPYITNRRISPKRDKAQDTKAHNEKWAHYYQNRQWKLLRDYYMMLHPICEMCLFEGRSVPAEHCHHRVPFSQGATEEERMQLLLNPDNLQALCAHHHHIIHQQLKHNN